MSDPPTAQPDGGVPNTAEVTDTLPAAAAATNVVTASGATSGTESVELPSKYPPPDCSFAEWDKAHAGHVLPNDVKHAVNQKVLELLRAHRSKNVHRIKPTETHEKKEAHLITQLATGSPMEKTLREKLGEFVDKLNEVGHPIDLRKELAEKGAGELLSGNGEMLPKRDLKSKDSSAIENDVRVALAFADMYGDWATNHETNAFMRAVLLYMYEAVESLVENNCVKRAKRAIAITDKSEEEKASEVKELEGLVEAFKPTAEFRARLAAAGAMHTLFVKGMDGTGRQTGLERSFGKSRKNVVPSDITFESVCKGLVRNQQYFFAFIKEVSMRVLMKLPEEEQVKVLRHFPMTSLKRALDEKKHVERLVEAKRARRPCFEDSDSDDVEMEVDVDDDDE